MADTSLTDPLGRVVVLHDNTWFGHIIRGHPEMTRYRGLVEQTIRAPAEILVSHSDPDCRSYFGPGPRGLLVHVVVDVVRGIVKTAHLARRITGGSVEWSLPKP